MLDDVAVPRAEGVGAAFPDAEEVASLVAQLVARAWRRHGITPCTAEDIAQAALMAFWESRSRYPVASEHPAILSGIFRHMCLRHVRRTALERKRLSLYCTDPESARANAWLRGDGVDGRRGLLGDLAAREARREIVDAIQKLSPRSRELAELITEEGLSRRELIERFGVNPNTLDTRLRSCRLELRRLLRGNLLAG